MTKTESRAKEIAETIMHQLGGQRRLHAMVGMKHWFFEPSTEESAGSLIFRFKGSKDWNTLRVTLRYDDTYNVLFSKQPRSIPGKFDFTSKPKQELFEMIYADQLVSLFEKETGLYLTF